MSSEKMTTLVQRLSEKTKPGEIDWEETSEPNTFQVAFPDYVVKIRYEIYEDKWGDSVGENFFVTILNDKGRVIDQVDIGGLASILHEPNIILKELYAGARRKALGADKALDDILSKLN